MDFGFSYPVLLFFVERFEVHPMFRLQRPWTRSHHRNVLWEQLPPPPPSSAPRGTFRFIASNVLGKDTEWESAGFFSQNPRHPKGWRFTRRNSVFLIPLPHNAKLVVSTTITYQLSIITQYQYHHHFGIGAPYDCIFTADLLSGGTFGGCSPFFVFVSFELALPSLASLPSNASREYSKLGQRCKTAPAVFFFLTCF